MQNAPLKSLFLTNDLQQWLRVETVVRLLGQNYVDSIGIAQENGKLKEREGKE